MQKMQRVFSAEFKAAAVSRMQAGESPSELSRSLNVRRSVLYRWRDSVLKGTPIRKPGRPRRDPDAVQPAAEPTARVKELERLVGQLTLENRFFKGALQRIKELRQQSTNTGEVASTRKSKPQRSSKAD